MGLDINCNLSYGEKTIKESEIFLTKKQKQSYSATHQNLFGSEILDWHSYPRLQPETLRRQHFHGQAAS